MLAVEGMDNVVLLGVDLILDFDVVFNKVDELLHLGTEQPVDVDGKFFAERLDPLNAWASISLATALRAVIHDLFSSRLG